MDVQLTIPLCEFQMELIESNVPFASYRLPGELNPVTIYRNSDVIEYQRISNILDQHSGFVLAPFAENEPVLFLQAEHIIEGFEFVVPSISKFSSGKIFLDGPEFESIGKVKYTEKVKHTIEKIRSGEADKIVISRRILKKWPNAPQYSGELFHLLCQMYPSAFVYLVNLPGKGLWTGASPEVFLSRNNGKISTMSLSGTRPKKESFGKWGQKEIEEHLWVSHFISETLEKAGCIEILVSPMHTAEAGIVEHLRTNYEAMCPEGKLSRLIETLHPTPAVCGWPTYAAKKHIELIEHYDRSFYTGFLGPVSDNGDFNFYVNLRCMHITSNQAVIYVGGGITIDSDPETEWDETELKSRTMLGAIEKIANFAG